MKLSKNKTTVKQGWHRVCLNTIVRATKELGSARLRILPMGSRVHLVEVQGRRVRIDQPIDGWCSIESSNGDQILSPIQTADGQHNSSYAQGSSGDLGAETAGREVSAIKEKRQDIAKELNWLRQEVTKTHGIKQERDQARQALSEAADRVEELSKTTKDQQSKIDLLTTELNKGGPGSKPEYTLQERIKELEQANELSRRQLNDLEKITQKKEKENERLKNQMGHMAESVPSSSTSVDTAYQNGDVALMKNR
eukprot:UN22771